MGKRTVFASLGAVALLALAAVLALAQPAGPQQATYVGMDTCKLCHSDIYNSFIQTLHP